ncbi:MAG: hypothetical protein NTZ37_08980 [Methanoregula sp.]|jgi:hypothetical protein|nr:hypothetical protein [Methanoregula sp.]
MRAYAVMLLIILSASMVVPVMAANEDRYSYITVQDIQVQLDNGSAVIHVNYKVEENTRFIFFLLGKQDLKNKLMRILNYQDAKINRIDLSSADFTVEDASLSYGNGIYWYPSHTFNIAIPLLSVKSPQAVKNFTMTKEFPGGMGYFATDTRIVQSDVNNITIPKEK